MLVIIVFILFSLLFFVFGHKVYVVQNYVVNLELTT